MIDLPYGLAHFLAKWCALPYQELFNLDGEPLLHSFAGPYVLVELAATVRARPSPIA